MRPARGEVQGATRGSAVSYVPIHRHRMPAVVCYRVFVSVNKQTFYRDRLEVRVFADRSEAGAAGAEIAAGIMRDEIERAGRAAVVFASAVSQDPFLAALRAQEIDWTPHHRVSHGRVRGDVRRTIRRRSADSCGSVCSTMCRWRRFTNWMARRRTPRRSASAMPGLLRRRSRAW